MRKRLFYGIGIVLLVLSVVLVVWQGSFSMKDFPPSNPSQTLIFWAMSTLIFILMVTVGWILLREIVKLYVARQANRAGSRIRTKLAVGAMSLSCGILSLSNSNDAGGSTSDVTAWGACFGSRTTI